MYITEVQGFINFMKGVVFQTVTALDTILANIGTFLTAAIGWMGDVLEVVVTEPALMVMVIAMPIAGFAVGLLSRLIRL